MITRTRSLPSSVIRLILAKIRRFLLYQFAVFRNWVSDGAMQFAHQSAVEDVRDYEAEDGLDAGCPPQAFPERRGRVDAGGGSRAWG
jgi:hypothetical protein